MRKTKFCHMGFQKKRKQLSTPPHPHPDTLFQRSCNSQTKPAHCWVLQLSDSEVTLLANILNVKLRVSDKTEDIPSGSLTPKQVSLLYT